MNLARQNYFFDTIYHLRNSEEIILYNKIFDVDSRDENDVVELLRSEYENECIEYPNTAPVYDESAALWAAKTIYVAAQLLLHRQAAGDELPNMLPPYTLPLTAGAILSADLCLRFMPQLLSYVKLVSPDDALQPILEGHLTVWHYSAIGYVLQSGTPQVDDMPDDNCLWRLYMNRIIEKKDKRLALLPQLQQHVKASLGNYADTFWRELNM